LVKTALISVSNKEGIVDFAKVLAKLKVEILSTGGTSELLKKNGIKVTDVSSYTEFPEMMGGRVKTLHPKIHGGILALRSNKEHMETAKKHGIKLIDLVVVNLYPFKETIQKEDLHEDEAIEQIDIGGPSMIRSAGKNFSSVIVVVDPKDYPVIGGMLIIVSPLPDEIGLVMLGMSHLSLMRFVPLSFAANAGGIYLIALAAQRLG